MWCNLFFVSDCSSKIFLSRCWLKMYINLFSDKHFTIVTVTKSIKLWLEGFINPNVGLTKLFWASFSDKYVKKTKLSVISFSDTRIQKFLPKYVVFSFRSVVLCLHQVKVLLFYFKTLFLPTIFQKKQKKNKNDAFIRKKLIFQISFSFCFFFGNFVDLSIASFILRSFF